MSNSPKPNSVRFCSNIKSKRHPDVRCPYRATKGEFCGFHEKNPCIFIPKTPPLQPSKIENYYAYKIQHFWKRYKGLHYYRVQGPAYNDPSLANNDCDVYSFEPTTTIPRMYRWSYADSHKNIWMFDMRTLLTLYEKNSEPVLQNPYTRENFPEPYIENFRRRILFLRNHKYVLSYNVNQDMTPDQLWHQRILDVIMKLDGLGFHTCVSWFEDLTSSDLLKFYIVLYELWHSVRITPPHVRNMIIQDYDTTLEGRVFDRNPRLHGGHDKRWWQNLLLHTIECLITKGVDKDSKTLGAVLVIRAYSFVNIHIQRQYNWLL